MWQVHYDKPVRHLGAPAGEAPSDAAAPVVPDNNRILLTLAANHRGDILYQYLHVVILNACGLVAEVIAASIHRSDGVVSGQCVHLMAPGIPKIGEAVNEHD